MEREHEARVVEASIASEQERGWRQAREAEHTVAVVAAVEALERG